MPPAVPAPDSHAFPAGATGAVDAATSALDPPFAVVDLDAFDHNAAETARRAAGKPVRLVTKSVRCRELLRRALCVPGFAGLMCYSLAEALWLHREGLGDDIVVAYPTADRAALRELAPDPAATSAITLTVDSTEHLDLIEAALGGRPPGSGLRLCLEIDASWRPLVLPGHRLHVGTRRSPVHSVDEARDLAVRVRDRPGFRPVGLLLYEGQIAGLGDSPPNPLLAATLRWMQRRSAGELARRRPAVSEAVREVVALEFVNGGGTGSLERTASESAVTEVAAGSGLLGPTLFDSYRAFRPRPAAMFALPVVHRPAPDVVTVFAGGYPASGQVKRDRAPSPYLPEGLRLTRTEGVGEVQTPVRGPAAARLRIGDRVWFRHAKAGELAGRFTTYHLLSDWGFGRARVTASVPTYRGEGRSFG